MKNNKFKQTLGYVFWIIACLVVIGVSTYPFIADYRLAQKQQRQIEQFDKKDSKTSKQDYLAAFYKKQASQISVNDPFKESKKKKDKANSVDVAKSQLNTIGILAIPKIKEVLPIYDNTSNIALDNGVGLLEHTSDITGGKNKHAVLTGHSGLSLNKLFTDLPKLEKGDKFFIKVNGKIHAYQVDQIKKVVPTDLKDLQVEKDKDLVTLITCAPLFINTHRLLVRGHRISYNQDVKIVSDGGITSLGKAVLVGTIIMTVMLITAYFINKKRKKTRKKGLRKV